MEENTVFAFSTRSFFIQKSFKNFKKNLNLKYLDSKE